MASSLITDWGLTIKTNQSEVRVKLKLPISLALNPFYKGFRVLKVRLTLIIASFFEYPYLLHQEPYLLYQEPYLFHQEPYLLHQEPYLLYQELLNSRAVLGGILIIIPSDVEHVDDILASQVDYINEVGYHPIFGQYLFFCYHKSFV